MAAMALEKEVGNEKSSNSDSGRDEDNNLSLSQDEKETGAHQVEAQAHIDKDIERRVVRKLDWHVLALLSGLFLLAYLDRSNIGNARTAGMEEDLKLDQNGHTYQWLLTIFYIAYVLAEPTILLWKVIPPHIFAAVIVLGWGVVSSAQAAVHSWGAEMALRFLMGVFEAAYGPGVVYLLSFFYLRREIGLRCGLYFAAAPLATTFAGALAYGITSGKPAIRSWRVLFLVEGLPTVAMAPVAYFLLPDSPAKTRFLTPEERQVAAARGVRQAGTAARVGNVNLKETLLTLLDAKAWFTALMYFSVNVSYSSLPVFLPTILQDMGFAAVDAQGLTAPPYFLSFLVTIATTYLADRWQQRGYMVAVLASIAGIGYIILATSTSVGARYFAVFLAAAGVFPAIANILPWTLNNQGSDSRRGAGVTLLNLVGQCGPFLGTAIYPTTDKPRYIKGQAVCAAFMFFVAALALCLRVLLIWENKKLDKKYGERSVEDDEVGVENYGPAYRYVL